jgi:hypothetical protein
VASRGAKQATFWMAVAGVSLMAPVVMNITVDKVGDKVPGLLLLDSYRTRRNG